MNIPTRVPCELAALLSPIQKALRLPLNARYERPIVAQKANSVERLDAPEIAAAKIVEGSIEISFSGRNAGGDFGVDLGISKDGKARGTP